MADRAYVVTNKEQGNPYSGSSLVPMLVIGLVLTFAGMIAALFELTVFSASLPATNPKGLRKGAKRRLVRRTSKSDGGSNPSIPAWRRGLLRFLATTAET